MTRSDWQRALTAQIARNIEYHRVAQGVRRVDLAARCTALGLPTKRPALAALLDARRQTVTLQELIVLAEALDVSLAELIVPLHTGGLTITGPHRSEDALAAAARLFAVDDQRGAATRNPYRPYVRVRRAAARFERANARLADLSHALATGAVATGVTDGRPHPASEILAAEAALSRLSDACRDLAARGLERPPMGAELSSLLDNDPPRELPVLDLIHDRRPVLVPLFLYRLHQGHLPSVRLVTEA